MLVAIDYGKPKKGEPLRPAEKLLWAGTPFLRKRTVFLLFVLWMILLIVPSILLVDLVDAADKGGGVGRPQAPPGGGGDLYSV